jgi:predicted CopG family antitoxin
MKTKLTLSIDPVLVAFAHTQAKKEGRSVSEIFERYLHYRRVQLGKKTVPSIRDMVGSLKSYDIDDSKEAIREAYAQKYLR